MSGDARLNITGTAYVGNIATGTFDQAGGTHTAAALVIGSAGGKGTYTLRRGGVLNVTATEDVGYGNSDGTFNQTEGTHTADTLNVGNGDFFGTATGHFTLTGPSTLTVTGGVYVGRDGGQGTFTHSGGTHVTSLLAVGSGHSPTRDSQGSYFFGSTATLTVNSSETIGDDGGTGLFSQTSGTHTIKGAAGLRLAVGSTLSHGTFQLSGGTLTTPVTQVGLQGLATFKQTAGTHTVNGDLTIALSSSAQGSYSLSGSGMLTTTDTVLGGHGGTSSFTQSGGTHTATAALKILSDSTGYTLSGGRLLTPLVQTGAAFNVSGGTADVGEIAGSGIVTATGGQLNAAHLRVSTFSASNTAHVTVLPSGGAVSGTSQFNKLTIAGGATFDLSDNAALVDYATPSPLPSLRDAVVRASQAGWTGPGLTSSSIVIHPNAAVGYAEASDALGLTGSQTASFAGQTADASTVLVRYTLAGDANLDGRVDFSDLVRLAQNYNTNVSASGDGWWSRGDFTYDGITDFSDLVKLAQNYNTALPSASIPGAPAAFQSDLAAVFARVPEPTAPPILFLASVALTRRRKKPRSA